MSHWLAARLTARLTARSMEIDQVYQRLPLAMTVAQAAFDRQCACTAPSLLHACVRFCGERITMDKVESKVAQAA